MQRPALLALAFITAQAAAAAPSSPSLSSLSPPSTTHPTPSDRPVRSTGLRPGQRLVEGQLLIKPGTAVKDPAAFVAALSKDARAPLRLVRTVVLDWLLVEADGVATEDATLALIAKVKTTKGVRDTAAVWVWRAFATPSDPFFEFMWHLDAIGARAAWDRTQGRTANLVGVVDTGTVFGHEDFVGKNAAGFDFISDANTAADGNGRDADANDPGDASECSPVSSFHGTHVGGTILANGSNNVGITGVNWNARLVTGRALGRCGGTNVDINEAVAWMAGFEVNPAPTLAQANRPRVINLSLGLSGQPCDGFTDDVFRAVTQRGHILVVAAGNDGNNVAVASPANCSDAVAVAAFGPRGGQSLAPYSNFGPEIAVIAPGGDQGADFNQGVLSAVDASVSPFQGGTPYSFYEGTSMAAPHVAGVISLMLDVNPSLSKTQVTDLLKSNGGSCSTCRNKPTLRADLAVNAAAGTQLTTNPGDSCTGTGFCSNGQTCSSTVNPVCQQDCTDDADCDADERCANDVCVPRGGEGEGEGEPDVGECDVRRGNMDCNSGSGCVERDGLGECVRGRDGDKKNGELCESNSDCGSGLCDRGVCTTTCDDQGCRDGYRCSREDDSGVPGGLCRADSCADDPDICGEGFDCSFSSEDRYVCAVGPSNYRGFCGAMPMATTPVWFLALLLAWRRRRR